MVLQPFVALTDGARNGAEVPSQFPPKWVSHLMWFSLKPNQLS